MAVQIDMRQVGS